LGLRVRTRRELAEALEHAVADQGRFVLIDVVMERGQMSSTLSRYVEAFERQRSQGS
jgi:indolepyruvate decarboxylase